MTTIDLRLDGDDMILVSPYDPQILPLIKSLSMRKWDPEYPTGRYKPGAWRVPYSLDRYREVVESLGRFIQLDVRLAERAKVDRDARAAAAEIKAVGDGMVLGYTYLDPQPYAHQRMGHAFLDHLDTAGLLWEMGCGKTRTVIDDLLRRKERGEDVVPAIVVCPNEVKQQWARQVPLWSGGLLTVEVLKGSTKKRAQRLLESDADVLVVNCEALIYMEEALLSKEWGYVVVDEVTRFKNAQTQRTKLLLKLKSRVKRILTGTPITQSPLDAYAPFSFLDKAIFGSWWAFQKRYLIKGGYGGYEIIGFDHMDELKEKVASISSRVLKRDVLDLPPKVYQDVEVELSGKTLEHYLQMREYLRAWWGESDQDAVTARIALTQLLRLAQITGGLMMEGEAILQEIEPTPKLEALKELLADLPPTEKVVIYGVYQHELERIAKTFPEWHPRLIYGDVPLAHREEAVRLFQDPKSDCRMIVAQIHSGGIGIDLYAAQTVIYYTRNWSLEDYLQSQDRLHRIGQTGTVNIVHLIAKLPEKEGASIDEAVRVALETKQKYADMVTGDNVGRDDSTATAISAVLA